MNAMSRWFVLFVCLVVSVSAFAIPIGGSCPPLAPSLDGVIRDGEWDGAQVVALDVNLPGGGTAPARFYVTNTGFGLYAALGYQAERPDGSTQFDVTLDANYDRMLSAGDDACSVGHDPWGGDTTFDDVYYTGKPCPDGSICGATDETFGGTNEVMGAGGFDGTTIAFEMSKPLIFRDVNDAVLYSGTTIGLQFHIRIFSTDGVHFADTYYPAGPRSGQYVDYTVRDCGFK